MAATSTPAYSKSQRPAGLTFAQRRAISHTIVHLLLISGVVLMLIPLAWTLSTSLKSPGEVFIFPPKWIPSEIRWQNYADAVTAIPFFRYLWNTTLITGLSIIGKVISIMDALKRSLNEEKRGSIRS